MCARHGDLARAAASRSRACSSPICTSTMSRACPTCRRLPLYAGPGETTPRSLENMVHAAHHRTRVRGPRAAARVALRCPTRRAASTASSTSSATARSGRSGARAHARQHRLPRAHARARCCSRATPRTPLGLGARRRARHLLRDPPERSELPQLRASPGRTRASRCGSGISAEIGFRSASRRPSDRRRGCRRVSRARGRAGAASRRRSCGARSAAGACDRSRRRPLARSQPRR